MLLIHSRHILAQIGHQQVILQEYSNCDGIHMYCNASLKFLLVKIGSDPTLYYINK
jgi:hypothetical protein